MVESHITYLGQLRCELVHGPSQTLIVTDAPRDNMGKGEAFSPTDLVGAALASCILTTMGIVAQRLQIDMTGCSAKVVKEMVTVPTRRIGKLTVVLTLPITVTEEQQQRLENAGRACPVHKSLHPDVKMPIEFHWGGVAKTKSEI